MIPALQTVPNAGIPAGLRRRPKIEDLIRIIGTDEEPKTLYVNRPLKNADALIAWAREAGFKQTLPADDIHVTVAFSKEPVDWSALTPDDEEIHLDAGGPRSVERLGDKGAVVLRFKMTELNARWQQFRDAGASWDYPSYKPHLTLTYDAGDLDLAAIEPYDGPLDFGAEEFAEVDPDAAEKAKAGLIGDEFSEADHPRAPDGEFGSGGGGKSPAAAKPGGAHRIADKLKQHGEVLRKNAIETKEWLADKSVGEALAAVAKHEKTKEALSLALQSLVSHATGADASTWKLNEQIIEHTVSHFGDITQMGVLQAKSMLRNGVSALLALRTGKKMASDAEDGVAAFLEALLDVLDDGELAATDSALALALDRDSVRETDRDGRLRIKTANISKATVNPYKGHEIPDWEKLGLDPNKVYHLLRDPEELEKAAPTFNGVQILQKHTPVSADDHQPWDVVGSTGTEAKFEAPYLKNSLNIWTRKAIDGIDSEEARELSCGYHYRAVMTPGDFGGMRYDGVMRDIVGNHVALVKDGRAGPDVVVGDSNEEITMSTSALARSINAAALRTASFVALSHYLKPRLAMDSGVSLAKAFDGVTGKTFKDKKPAIAASIRAQAKGKMASDTSLDDVEKVLDMLDAHEIDGGDESVSEAQHKAMEAAAHGASNLDIPEKVGKEFVRKDDKGYDAEGVGRFLKEKGMADDDISAVMGMLPKKPAVDEDPEEKKKREEEARKKEEDDKAKDAAMKDMVTKPAMDAAIKLAVDETAKSVRANERGIREALKTVRPIVGELDMAFDSAEEVYRHVLAGKGVADAKTIHASALPTLIGLLPKAGARETPVPRIGMDAAQVDGFNKRFPEAARIGTA